MDLNSIEKMRFVFHLTSAANAKAIVEGLESGFKTFCRKAEFVFCEKHFDYKTKTFIVFFRGSCISSLAVFLVSSCVMGNA